jgi:hypothetical protein
MPLTDHEIEQLIERAAERGAEKALHSLGLHDENAPADVKELRGLLEAWRDVKSTALRTATGWLTVAVLSLLALGAGAKFWQDGGQ